MGNKRLTGLALLYVHHNIPVNLHRVIDEFAHIVEEYIFCRSVDTAIYWRYFCCTHMNISIPLFFYKCFSGNVTTNIY